MQVDKGTGLAASGGVRPELQGSRVAWQHEAWPQGQLKGENRATAGPVQGRRQEAGARPGWVGQTTGQGRRQCGCRAWLCASEACCYLLAVGRTCTGATGHATGQCR